METMASQLQIQNICPYKIRSSKVRLRSNKFSFRGKPFNLWSWK